MPQVNELDRYSLIGLSEQDAAAVTEIESLGWAVQTVSPPNTREGIPAVFGAEQVGSLPIRRSQSHTLTGLLRAVQGDIARRGEPKPVAIETGLVAASATSTPNEGAA